MRCLFSGLLLGLQVTLLGVVAVAVVNAIGVAYQALGLQLIGATDAASADASGPDVSLDATGLGHAAPTQGRARPVMGGAAAPPRVVSALGLNDRLSHQPSEHQ